MIDKIRTWYYIVKYQYILRKVRFGINNVIKCKISVRGPGKVIIGDNCCFETDPWGNGYVTLYTHLKKARIIIGNNVTLRATRFGSHLEIKILDNALIETASVFDSDFHNVDYENRDEDFNQNDRKVIIGQGSYVGCECLCSKGTELGSNVVMLPVSVTGTKVFSDNSKIGGFPARKMR